MLARLLPPARWGRLPVRRCAEPPARLQRSQYALVLASAVAGLLLPGCAAPSPRPSEAALTDATLQQRGKALEALAATALLPCAAQLAADESGVFVVSAKPDGSVILGPLQWRGAAAGQQCITQEAVKARLPAYNGPSVTWLWSIGSAAHPAPGPLQPPAGYRERLSEQTHAIQGQGSVAIPLAQSPLASCPLRSPAPDAFASLVARLFVFPDGHVAGATPIAAAADGQEAVFMDCAMDLVRAWRFPAFSGPGFVVIDAPLQRGLDPRK